MTSDIEDETAVIATAAASTIVFNEQNVQWVRLPLQNFFIKILKHTCFLINHQNVSKCTRG